MSNNTGTLSERILSMLDDADQLYAKINRLAREVQKREGIESIEYLADVPGELVSAKDFAYKLCSSLQSAETAAKMGGA